jgi:hypothetical protein
MEVKAQEYKNISGGFLIGESQISECLETYWER